MYILSYRMIDFPKYIPSTIDFPKYIPSKIDFPKYVPSMIDFPKCLKSDSGNYLMIMIIKSLK